MTVLRTRTTSGTDHAEGPAAGKVCGASRLALISAAIAFYALYYWSLLLAFVRSLSLQRPSSVIEGLCMVRLVLKVRPYTAVFVPRLAALYTLGRDIEYRAIPGDIVECGVYNGGSSALVASVCCRAPDSGRRIWLFDSFEGLPQPTERDGAAAQSCGWWCHGHMENVRRIHDTLDVPVERRILVKGWFHETFPTVDIPRIALLHIDADWYDSVKLCLERFYDNVQPGGYVVIDDYGHWEGCRLATDEFMISRDIQAPLVTVDYTGRYFMKPASHVAVPAGREDAP